MEFERWSRNRQFGHIGKVVLKIEFANVIYGISDPPAWLRYSAEYACADAWNDTVITEIIIIYVCISELDDFDPQFLYSIKRQRTSQSGGWSNYAWRR